MVATCPGGLAWRWESWSARSCVERRLPSFRSGCLRARTLIRRETCAGSSKTQVPDRPRWGSSELMEVSSPTPSACLSRMMSGPRGMRRSTKRLAAPLLVKRCLSPTRLSITRRTQRPTRSTGAPGPCLLPLPRSCSPSPSASSSQLPKSGALVVSNPPEPSRLPDRATPTRRSLSRCQRLRVQSQHLEIDTTTSAGPRPGPQLPRRKPDRSATDRGDESGEEGERCWDALPGGVEWRRSATGMWVAG